jgi:predicted nucleic acid-binding protein
VASLFSWALCVSPFADFRATTEPGEEAVSDDRGFADRRVVRFANRRGAQHEAVEHRPSMNRATHGNSMKRKFEDSYSAATALRHGLTIATGNDRDFRRPGLRVFNPFKELA